MARWNWNELYGTITFAAQSIMKLLPPDRQNNARMAHALKQLQRVKMGDHRQLFYVTSDIHMLSFDAVSARHYYAHQNSLPEHFTEFQEHQAMLAYALRYLS